MNPSTVHQPSQGARFSLYYITVGSLVVIWSAIWFYYLRHSDVPSGDTRYYICTGLLLSGLAVLVIGTLVGRIGQEGKAADVPIGEIKAAAVTPPAQGANGAAPPVQPVATAPVGAVGPSGGHAPGVTEARPRRGVTTRRGPGAPGPRAGRLPGRLGALLARRPRRPPRPFWRPLVGLLAPAGAALLSPPLVAFTVTQARRSASPSGTPPPLVALLDVLGLAAFASRCTCPCRRARHGALLRCGASTVRGRKRGAARSVPGPALVDPTVRGPTVREGAASTSRRRHRPP
ncbi:MAG: hypothetical protein U0797_09745 [Gemmataceae bacterium]